MIKNKINKVFLVCQTQGTEMANVPIAIYTDEKQAQKLARALNKAYGAECEFTKSGDFCDITGCYDLCHFYTVERKELDPEIENFL